MAEPWHLFRWPDPLGGVQYLTVGCMLTVLSPAPLSSCGREGSYSSEVGQLPPAPPVLLPQAWKIPPSTLSWLSNFPADLEFPLTPAPFPGAKKTPAQGPRTPPKSLCCPQMGVPKALESHWGTGRSPAGRWGGECAQRRNAETVFKLNLFSDPEGRFLVFLPLLSPAPTLSSPRPSGLHYSPLLSRFPILLCLQLEVPLETIWPSPSYQGSEYGRDLPNITAGWWQGQHWSSVPQCAVHGSSQRGPPLQSHLPPIFVAFKSTMHTNWSSPHSNKTPRRKKDTAGPPTPRPAWAPSDLPLALFTLVKAFWKQVSFGTLLNS